MRYLRLERAAGLSIALLVAGPNPGEAHETPAPDADAGVNDIAGCAEVLCPNPIEDSTENVCTLQDQTFSDVGMRRFGGGRIEDTELAWVQGSSRSNNSNGDGGVLVSSAFYLGTPFEYDAGDVRACAAFFHRTSGNTTAGPRDGDIADDSATSSCERMGVPRPCIDALTSRARLLKVREDDDACAVLEDSLRGNFDEDCVGVAGGDRWEGLRVRPILGHGAPAPILSSDNLTSNCWPITPKEHDLAFIDSHEETARDIYGVTPILTVFYDWGQTATVPEISTTMSCIRVVNSSVAAEEEREEREEDEDDDDDENTAARFYMPGVTVLVPATIAALSYILLLL